MSSNLNSLLDKTSTWDKDERYMATSDLCQELQKDIKIDATMERRCASPPPHSLSKRARETTRAAGSARAS